MFTEELEDRRDRLLQELTADPRPGSLVRRYRKHGKANCHCAGDHAGPADGKTATRILKPDDVERVRITDSLCCASRLLAGRTKGFLSGVRSPLPGAAAHRQAPLAQRVDRKAHRRG